MPEQDGRKYSFKELASMRTGWFIHPAFQVKMLNKRFQLAILIYGLSIACGCLGALVYIFTCYVFGMKISQQEQLWEYFAQSSFHTSYFHWIAGIFILAFFIAYTFYITHKVAGPIYKLQQSMKKAVEEDNFSHLEFRPGDYLVEFCDDYNALMDKIKKSSEKGLNKSE